MILISLFKNKDPGSSKKKVFTLVPAVFELPRWLSVAESDCQCRRHRRLRFRPSFCGKIPWVERFSGGGHGHPLQYSCLGNPMDIGALEDRVHRIANSQAQLSTHASTYSTCLIRHVIPTHTHTHTWAFSLLHFSYLCHVTYEIDCYFYLIKTLDARTS